MPTRNISIANPMSYRSARSLFDGSSIRVPVRPRITPASSWPTTTGTAPRENSVSAGPRRAAAQINAMSPRSIAGVSPPKPYRGTRACPQEGGPALLVPRRALHDLIDGMHRGNGDDSLLQVDHDQCRL